MRYLHAFATALLLTACSNSGDFESNCTLTCSLPDGGVDQSQERVACCGEHDSPTHPNEEGSACTPDWVTSHAAQLCQSRIIGYSSGADGGYTAIVCPANLFHCTCSAPATYPSYNGCD